MTPVSNYPEKRDHFVYVYEVKGVPFYVGHGHAGRAKDRVKHTRRLMRRKARGDANVPWQPNTEVIAGLLEAGIEDAHITYVEVATGLTKSETLAPEVQEIRRLRAEGYVLANVRDNPNDERDPRTIVDGLLRRIASLT